MGVCVLGRIYSLLVFLVCSGPGAQCVEGFMSSGIIVVVGSKY